MNRYRYRAFDDAGTLIEGEIEASSLEKAQDRIWARGMTPFAVKPAFTLTRRPPVFGLSRRVRAQDVAAFTREFATLAEAELPLDDSLRLLHDQASPPMMRAVVAQMLADVLDGRTLSSSLRRRPDVFSNEYVAMVEAGEMSAAPGRALIDMADLLEKRLELQGKARNALVYPGLLIATALVSVGIVLSVLVPSLAPIFIESGTPLPAGLSVLIGVRRHAAEIVGGLAGLGLLLVLATRGVRRVPELRLALARLRLRLPVVGGFLARREVARFARTLGTLRRAGVPLLPALTSARGVVANPAMAADLDRAIETVRDGGSLAASLRHVVGMPTLALRMVAVGEEAGRVEPMLLRLASLFDAQTQRAIDRGMSFLAPALTIVIAAIVGALIMTVMTAILGINELAAP